MFEARSFLRNRFCVYQKTIRFVLKVLVFLSLTFFANAAFSNDVVQQTINNILQKEEQRTSRENTKNNNVQNIFVNPAKLLIHENKNKSDKCILINNITIENQSLFVKKTEQFIKENIKNKCITGVDISNALNAISNIYIENGYITSRAFVAPQNLNSGNLKISIVEGVLDSIRLPEDKYSVSKINSAFPKERRSLLNLRNLEQGLEQMNRLASSQVEMSVKPSEKVGGSDVILKNNMSKPWSLQLSGDNFGSDSMGKFQSSISLGVDNILGINDQFNLSFNQNNKFSSTKGGRGNSVSVSFPKGYWLFKVGLNSHKYSQVITTPLSEFLTTGESKSSYIEAKKTFGRHKLGKSEINFKLSKKLTTNFLEDTKIDVSSYDLTTFIVGLKSTSYFNNSSLISEFKLHKGLNIFGADSDSKRIYSDDPEAQFVKATIDLDYTKTFSYKKVPVNYRGQLSLQLASDYLHSTEQFSVGGLYTVRGYETYSESSSRGMLVRNELDFNKSLGKSGIRYNPYLALDVGHVNNRQRNSTTLIGRAIGVRAFYKKLDIDLSYNQALKNIDGHKFTSDPFILGKINLNF